MIEITQLRKSYNHHREVLKGLQMKVKTGEVYGFLGENGSGKTTTMNIISGLISKNDGQVLVNGLEVTTHSNVSLGYLPEAPSLLEYMNGYEYLEYISACCGYKGDSKQRSREVMDLVGLTHAAKRPIKGYSRGMQQRVAMGAAMYAGHQVIILDEPTSALDPQGRADMMRIIQTLKEMGKTILLSTHILSDVERVADRIGILRDGSIALEGSLDKIISKMSLNMLRFTLREYREDVARHVHGLSYVEQLNIDKNTYYVFLENDTDIAQANQHLFQSLATGGADVLEYGIQKDTLEQIYMKVVHGQCS